MGIALLLSGIGFIVLAAGLLGPEGLLRRRTETSPPAQRWARGADPP